MLPMTIKSKMTLLVPGPNNVRLVLDPADEATPAMIFAGAKKWAKDGLGPHSATYDCAMGTGCVGDNEDVELTPAQQTWLSNQSSKVEQVYEVARPEGWDK